jgi:hypothetical protein
VWKGVERKDMETKEIRRRLGAMGRTKDISKQDKQRVEKINEILNTIPVCLIGG